MKITHRLFASIIISAVAFIFLLAVTDIVTGKQQNSQQIRTLINKLDKQFLHAQVEVRAHPDNPQFIEKAFKQIDLTREQMQPLQATAQYGEIEILSDKLDLYQQQFTEFAVASAQISAMEQSTEKNMDSYNSLLEHKQKLSAALTQTEGELTRLIQDFDKRLEKYVVRKDLSLERLRWISALFIIFISLILTNHLVSSFTRPFKRLIAHINLLTAGQLNIQTDITGKDELGQLGQLLNSMSRQLDRAFDELKSERDMLATTVEQLNRTQLNLQQAETKYNRLFETSADAILILNGEKIMQCNRAALQLFHVNSIEIFKTLQLSDLSPDKQANDEDSFLAINQHISAAYKHGEHQFEWLLKQYQGETFTARVIFTVLDLGYTQLLQAAIRKIEVA
jgi:nitrate/nitrite-specific signal transduction histidine kinase